MQTRLSTFAIAALALTGAAALAGTRSETATYVDGNLTGISPNTGGTLTLSDDKATFRTGLNTVPIPYANLTHSELGAVKETAHDVPLYKVWALHKRFGGKTETQLLIVNFKTEEGEEKTMTLELGKAAAPGILSAIQSHSPNGPASERTLVASSEPAAKASDSKSQPEKTLATRPDKPATAWWGDEFWKTSRNADKWNAKAPGTND